MELNERLRELRKEQGETQKQVAAAIGIGERPYQYLESGEHLSLGLLPLFAEFPHSLLQCHIVTS